MSTPIKIALAGLLACVSLMLILGAVMAFLTPARPPAGKTETPADTGIAPSAPKGPALNYGEPNEPCATNRLGESFDFNGVTYTCSGPKPYRWRAQ